MSPTSRAISNGTAILTDLVFAQRGFRSVLSVPMLRGESAVGAITVWHAEVGPFTDKHVTLLKTFADQAVIAIENVRLFQELGSATRNCARRWSIRRQPAEVLGIISRSPTDVQPVLDAIVESAARVCGIDDVVLRLREGDNLVCGHILVPYPSAASRSVLMSHSFAGCASMARFMFPTSAAHRTISQCWVADAAAFAPYLVVPLRQQGEFIGVIDRRVASRCAPSPRRRSNCSKPSPTRP